MAGLVPIAGFPIASGGDTIRSLDGRGTLTANGIHNPLGRATLVGQATLYAAWGPPPPAQQPVLGFAPLGAGPLAAIGLQFAD